MTNSPSPQGPEPAARRFTVVTTCHARGYEDYGRTMVEIAEEGWRETTTGLKASYGNCMGWAQMVAALKAWVEHGINLREGMYK